MEETWKPILGYNGRYLVSNYGNVKSMIHKDYPNGKLMSPAGKDEPYLRISISKYSGGNINKVSVHRAVWEAFNGKIPEGLQVNHIDEDKHNNHLDNLNLMTAKENTNWGTAIDRRVEKQTPGLANLLKDIANTDTTLEYVSGYLNYSTKCHFKCSVCGYETDVKPAVLIYKGGLCKVCSGKNKSTEYTYTKSDAQAVLDSKFNNNISIISYNGIEETGTFKCNTCNQQYKRVFSHQRDYTGNGCPYCLDKKPFTLNTHDAILAINKKFKGNITILSKEVNSNLDLCDFRCNTCGDVFQRVYGEEQRRKGNGCGNCERLTKLAKQFDKAKAKLNARFNGNIVFTDTQYAGSHEQSHFKCLACGANFTKTYHAESTLSGNGHPKCPNK